MDELMLKNIQSIADTERRIKEELLEDNKKANRILRSFQERLCKENGLGTPTYREDDSTAVELVNSLITDTRVVIHQLSEKLKKENVEKLQSDFNTLSKNFGTLQQTNQALLIELEKSKKPAIGSPIQDQGSNQKLPDSRLVTGEDNYVESLIEILKSIPKTEPEPKTAEPPIQAAPPPQTDNGIGTKILKLAGNSRLFKLVDLVDLSMAKLDLPEVDIKKEVDNLEASELLIIQRTNIKPTAPGVSYSPLFTLSNEGLAQAGVKKVSELDRWLQLAPGLSYEEAPLLVYAVEQFFPKHGYSFVSFFEEKKIEKITKPVVFTPHIHLKDEMGENVYLMFEGFNTRGAAIHPYFDDYKSFTNGRLYFLCPNVKVAKLVESAINYHKSKANITNVADWAKYDFKLQNGDQVPDSIWFTYLH